MIEITRQGASMPALGMGTWQMRGEGAVAAVRQAIDLGYRHIDTAQMYGNEAEVGRALAGCGVPRDELWLTTKIDNDNHSFERVKASVEESLTRLKTDYVDLLLIHWPVFADAPLVETLDAMAELHYAGKVRHLGVSNFSADLIAEAVDDLGHTILANQVEYHPYLGQEAVKAACAARDVIVTAYCPIVRGLVNEEPVLQAIALIHDKTPSQVTLRWLVQQDGVAAIPKAASEKNARANLDIFDFALTDDEMARIATLARGHRIVDPEGWSPVWDA
ncbi:MAG: aldo/keto reductase [Proteobacteria bacterium]|nr:aldo/keto reductase [Pseudomonadota bacterium]